MPKITPAEIRRRFTYHRPTPEDAEEMTVLRDEIGLLALRVAEVCPPCRETSLAITKLEEAAYWSIASLARPSEGVPG